MAEQSGHITGVGDVFVKSKDLNSLAQWYRKVLGLEVKPWGGAALAFDAPGHPTKASRTPSGLERLYEPVDAKGAA